MDLDQGAQNGGLSAQNNRGNSHAEEGNEEEKQSPPYVKYLDRCKKIGRVGPASVKMDSDSKYGNFNFKTSDYLDLQASSSWASIRANAGVFSGRYYYEATLRTGGTMQLGWCTL